MDNIQGPSQQPAEEPAQQPTRQPEFGEQPEFGGEPEQPAVEDVPVKKSKLWLWILIVIIVGIIGVAAACELGYLNLGIEKYWGAPPVDVKEALADSMIRMDKIESGVIEIDGQISMEATNLSQQSLWQSLEKLVLKKLPLSQSIALKPKVLGEADDLFGQNIDTNISFKIKNNISAPYKQAASAEISFTGGNFLFYDLTPYLGQESKITADFVNIDKDLYLKSNLKDLLGTEKWLHASMDDFGVTELPQQQVFDESQLQEYDKMIKSGKRLKSEMIDGIFCYHYEVILNLAQSSYDMPSAVPSDMPTSAKGEFWISRFDHYLRKFTVQMDFPSDYFGGSASFEMKGSQYNEPITVTAPAKDETVEAKEVFPELFALFQVSNDTTRKSDLAKIQTALEQYHQDHQQYPKTSGSEKTNDENSNIYKALFPDYLEEMSKDPNDPKNYYAYQSDGANYQLSCVLENKQDSEGQKVGNLYLYILKNQ